MKNLDVIAEDLFNKIRGRFPSVTIGDGDGKITNKPADARFYDFEYTEADRVLGNISISIDEESLSVMYSDNFVANEDQMTQNNWFNFLKELRQFSKKRMLNFDTRNITKSNLDKRDYEYLATNRTGDEQMTESKMYGSNKTSFQKIGNAKLSIKHSAPINTESALGRSQRIGKIFIESPEGEKFKYPFKHLSGARAMAMHVSEGGNAYDDFGQYIVGLSEELSKLKKFNSYITRSNVMAESLSGYVDVVKERMIDIKKDIHNLQKSSYYKEAIESFVKKEATTVPDDVAENWIDQLTIRQFNEELQDVFPYIYKLVSEATKAKEIGPDDLAEGWWGKLTASSVEDWAREYPEGALGDASRTFIQMRQRYKGTEWEAQIECRIKTFEDFVVIKDRMPAGPNGRPLMPQEPQAWLETNGNHKCAMAGQREDYNSRIEAAFEEMMGQFSEAAGCPCCESSKADCTCSPNCKGCDCNAVTEAGTHPCKECKGTGKVNGKPCSHCDGKGEHVNEAHPNSKMYDKCWDGYKKVPGKKRGEKGSCVKESDDCDSSCPKSCPDCGGTGDPEKYQAMKAKKEGNAYAQAVRQAKMNGKKKGDKVAGPDGEEITLEKKTPLGEFILSYFDYTTGQFPKGETAILTMVEKDYGERFITPAKQFIERINNRVAEVLDQGIGESGLQYYTGKKKYGKEGMAALAQAGREGASEEELGRIKDRYKKESEDIRRLAGL